jgi:hypothetical protein
MKYMGHIVHDKAQKGGQYISEQNSGTVSSKNPILVHVPYQYVKIEYWIYSHTLLINDNGSRGI